ncbi:transcription termination/antitermination protein NusA [Candidatus Dojkabacteria bacterium]|nr:transcription termination/antitermination protein NusA [Candidatus Dojkabacteria bacterium]
MAEVSEFMAAINQICSERGIDPEEVFVALEAAVLAAYKKDYGGGESLKAEIDRATGEVHIVADKKVVKKVTEEDTQISLKDAKKIEPNLSEGDHVEIEMPIEGFGRIAAQTAKQVILQKVRESEKNAVMSEFKERMGTVVTGLVQRMMGPTAVVEIGKAIAQMPPEEQIPNEFYKIGERYKFYLKEIKNEQDLVVTRSAPEFLIELFKLEVPEIESGIVEVKACAREAGSRSKLAVVSHQEGIDPIGSCVGQKGVRIANVMSELGEEKIDIIEWDEDIEQFVANALGPAQVEAVKVEDGVAKVNVTDDQLSLAIGKDGQNVRLAAKLTELKIDITSPSLEAGEGAGKQSSGKVELSTRVTNAIEKAGLSTKDLLKMSEEEILDVKGIGKSALEEINSYKTASEEKNEKATKDSDNKEKKTESKEEKSAAGEEKTAAEEKTVAEEPKSDASGEEEKAQETEKQPEEQDEKSDKKTDKDDKEKAAKEKEDAK